MLGVKPHQRVRVKDFGSGQVLAHESLEPLPRPPAALTAPPQRDSPVSRDLLPERFKPRQISRNRMVVEIPTDDLFQPGPGFRNRLVHAPSQFRSDTTEFSCRALPHCPAEYRELAAFVDRTANMSESQKVERFRFPLPCPLPVFCREPPELNQARLVRVQFQSVVRHALPQLLQKPLGFLPVLKPKHEVVRISNDDYLAERILPAPLHHPSVEYVVQVDIRQQRRDHRPLRSTHLGLRPLPILGYPGL